MTGTMHAQDDLRSSLPIGAVAARFGVAAHVLRHWEDVGLLRPARAPGGRRRYGAEELFRIGVIVRTRRAGLALADLREILDGGDRAAVLSRHRDVLRRRIAELTVGLDLVECALSCRDPESCTDPH